MALVHIRAPRRLVARIRQVSIVKVYFFRQSVVSEYFIQSGKAAALVGVAVLIDGFLFQFEGRREVGGILEIRLASFANSFGGAKEEHPIFKQWAANRCTGVP